MQNACPKSVYIHVPFCSRRCGYCNFTLITGRDDLISGYLDALELELRTTLGSRRPVETLFLGGGTPSYLQGEDLQRLVKLIHDWFQLADGGEFSCEVNPLDCCDDQLDALRAAGVNRISVGGQSFNDTKLQALERDHTADNLEQALNACSERFENLSLDLIFAAPNETLAQWEADVSRAMTAPIRHLSSYGLTVERGSAFYGRVAGKQLREVDEDVQLAMYEHTLDQLIRQGWEHYEVSSFAKPGFRCRHNESYWLGRPWWAFGPGAASFIPDERRTENAIHTMVRNVNHRSTTTYIRRVLSGRSPIAESEPVEPLQQLRERLVFGLRRLQGVDMHALGQWWGSDVAPIFAPYIDEFIDAGWLEFEGNTLRLTRSGLVISDSLWTHLL